MIDRLTIVGVGLIGGSLAMALRKAGYVREVVGVGRSRENLVLAKDRGIIDRYTHDPFAGGVAGADVVFLAVPPESIAQMAADIRPALKAGAIVTDGGSTKRLIAAGADAVYRLPDGALSRPEAGPAFVPGHPIAGTEKTGAGAAFAELFQGKRTILTPSSDTPVWAVEQITAMWEAAGAQVDTMDAAHHDAVLGAISHLPHAAAFALVNAVMELEAKSGGSILKFAAGGFLDITRIASSDPGMWRDIFLQNRDELLKAIHVYEAQVSELRKMIETRDADGLLTTFTRAKEARDGLVRR